MPLTKVVTSGMVEVLSREGYKLVDRYQEKIVETSFDQAADPNGTYSGATVGIQNSHVITQTSFVMELDDESTLTLVSGDLKATQKVVAEQVEELKKHKLEIENLEGKLTGQYSCANSYKANYEKVSNEYDLQRKSYVKLEEDLAKIRKAIGEMKYKEILKAE
jgi:hypothetical protein